MGDTVKVYFKMFSEGFNVSSVLADFSLFGHEITIRWYGAIIAFGFLLAVLFGGRLAYKWRVNLDHMIDVLIAGTLCGIVGARLYYCVFRWDYYSEHLAEILNIREGGLAIYGGLIGGLAGAFVVCKIRKINYYNLMDMGAMSFLLAQGIGRWGNFTNQEAFGTNTEMPWGMWSEKVAAYISANTDLFEQKGITVRAGSLGDMAYVHPTFLYESLWCLIGFGLLFIVLKKFRKFSGQLMLCYGVWYGTGRMIIEGFRTDSLYIADTGIRVSQALSAALVLICLVLLVVLLVKYTKHPKPIEGVDFFTESAAKKKEKPVKPLIAADEETEFTINRPVETDEDIEDEIEEAETENISRVNYESSESESVEQEPDEEELDEVKLSDDILSAVDLKKED